MILVTGGTGFVGPKIVHALRVEDRPVRCLVRDPDRAQMLASWGCELVRGDVTDLESVRRAAAGCEVVVHLVAIIQGKPEQFERIMIGGTRNVVDAAKQASARRFVLMSALGTSVQNRDTPYFNAKWEMEQAAKGSGLEHVVFRPSFIFGKDGGVLPTLVRLVRLAPVVPVIGPGSQRSQPIWIDNVAECFAKAIDAADVADRTFELGGPDVVTWNELYERIKRVLGKRRRPLLHVPMRLARVGATLVDAVPGPSPITPDQVRMLEGPDNVVAKSDAVDTFGVQLVPLDEQLRRAAHR